MPVISMFYGIIIRLYLLDNRQDRSVVRPSMYWDTKTVKPLPDYRIFVELEDGRRGIFDLKPYQEHGVFRELKDTAYFQRVAVVHGAVTWPHEQDIAPETLLAEMTPVSEPPVQTRPQQPQKARS